MIVLMFIALQVPILCGVFLACYKDIKFNLIGIVYASTGVCVASIYQVVCIAGRSF